jgi:large subunit ribosomal protein L10
LSLTRDEKTAVITAVSAQAAKSQTLAMAEYRGITVEQMNKLRVDARSKGVYLHVLKNTLVQRAVKGTSFEVAAGAMSGPLIYGFSEDAVAAAKVMADFAKGNDKLIVRAGAFAGKVLDAKGVQSLASIPSREVLLAQIAGLLKSPIQRIAVALGQVALKKGGPDAGAEAGAEVSAEVSGEAAAAAPAA